MRKNLKIKNFLFVAVVAVVVVAVVFVVANSSMAYNSLKIRCFFQSIYSSLKDFLLRNAILTFAGWMVIKINSISTKKPVFVFNHQGIFSEVQSG